MMHSLLESFQTINDPRQASKCLYPLHEVLFMATCATLCGADDWDIMTEFCQSRSPWLKQYIEMENGVPCPDTFGRIFAMIDPSHFQSAFSTWVKQVVKSSEHEQICIDGKALRGAVDHQGEMPPVLVNAWSCGLGVSLGFQPVDRKSNEIKAVPKLLEHLSIEGCLVSLDAMGTQQDIAQTILAKQGEYLLAVKDNQPSLYTSVQTAMNALRAHIKNEDNGFYYGEFEDRHGRHEHRRCWVSHLPTDEAKAWSAQTLIAIERVRQPHGKDSTRTLQYYISSQRLTPKAALNATRRHWHIENNLHWVLDVAFDEDRSRVRAGHAATNLAKLRQITLNLLKQDKSCKLGIKNKRKKCGFDESYLETVLGLIN